MKNMNSIKGLFSAIILSVGMGLAAQDNVLNPQSPEDWMLDGNYVQSLNKTTPEDGNALILKGKGIIYSKEMINIEPAKKYRLSGFFKAASWAKNSGFYLGVQPYMENCLPLEPRNVNIVKGTETELAAACEAGDKVIKIKNGTAWKVSPYAYIAFNADTSGKYTDLPNLEVTPQGGIDKVEKHDDLYEVTLKTPCDKAFPAGTKVRVHFDGPTFMYAAANYVTPGTEWKEFKGVISGELGLGIQTNSWWKGTRKAKIIILVIGADQELMFKDIKIEEVK